MIRPEPISAEFPERSERTDFVREAAVRLAESVLLEDTVVRMNADAYAELMAVLSAPAAPVPELVEVFKRAAPWER